MDGESSGGRMEGVGEEGWREGVGARSIQSGREPE